MLLPARMIFMSLSSATIFTTTQRTDGEIRTLTTQGGKVEEFMLPPPMDDDDDEAYIPMVRGQGAENEEDEEDNDSPVNRKNSV